MKDRVKHTTIKIIPFVVMITGLFIVYYIVQYLLFQQQQVQIQENSQSLVYLIQSLQCQEQFVEAVRGLEVSNNTMYVLTPPTDGSPLLLQSVRMQGLDSFGVNATYGACLQQNRIVSNWLSNTNGGQFILNGQGVNSICRQFGTAISKFPQGAVTNVTIASCEATYQGILNETILQSVSIFLQDEFYSAIQFMSTQLNRSDIGSLKAYVGSPKLIDLLDSHGLYLRVALRSYYAQIIDQILSN